jgi:REP element-mobilizing transposase RayT
MENKELPKRKPNRLENFDYGAGYSYFITICTRNREKILSHIVGEDIILPQNTITLTTHGQIIEESILSINNHYENVFVEQYVIMPNHVHLILTIQDNGRIISSPTIPIIVGQLKRFSSKKAGVSLWQRSYYDHVIRNKTDYEEISKYIYENPINWETDEFYQKST